VYVLYGSVVVVTNVSVVVPMLKLSDVVGVGP
jgi:hypothetical protein